MCYNIYYIETQDVCVFASHFSADTNTHNMKTEETMEILFYRYNNICEPDILQTFQAFGITVHTEEMEMTDKTITPRQ